MTDMDETSQPERKSPYGVFQRPLGVIGLIAMILCLLFIAYCSVGVALGCAGGKCSLLDTQTSIPSERQP